MTKLTKEQFDKLVKHYNLTEKLGKWESNDFHCNGLFIPDIRSKHDTYTLGDFEVLVREHSETSIKYYVSNAVENISEMVLDGTFSELKGHEQYQGTFLKMYDNDIDKLKKEWPEAYEAHLETEKRISELKAA